jgi:hypothetical protein
MVDVMRYRVVVALIAIAAVLIAACGSSSTPSSPSPAASATSSVAGTPNAKPSDHVAGLIATVSGTTVAVTQRSGSATVDFTNATKVSEIDPAQLSDVTSGSCVTIRPTRDSQPNGPVTARTVIVSPADNGQCAQPHDGQNGRGVRGTVAPVNGATLAVTTAGNQTNVIVNSDTTYAKRVASNSQAISVGKCIAARGTNDTNGTLQATAITVRPAGNRLCPGPRR